MGMLRKMRFAFHLATVLCASIAFAQAPWSIRPEVYSKEGFAQPGEAYVSVDIALIEDASDPLSGPAKESAVRNILKALGFEDTKKRDFVLLAQVEIDGVKQPPHAFLTIKANEKDRSFERFTATNYRSPRVLVAPDRQILVKLFVRETTATQYDVGGAVGAVASMLPSNGLLNSISKPYFENALSAADTILNYAGKSNVAESYQVALGSSELSNKSVRFEITAPGGVRIATVAATLLASHSMTRDSSDIASFPAEQVPTPLGRHVTYSTAGGQFRAVDPIYALKQYQSLAGTPTSADVKAFCDGALANLRDQQRLSTTDTEEVIVQAVINAFSERSSTLEDPRWLRTCFTPNTFSQRVEQAGFSLTPTPSGRHLTSAQKNAFRCWMSATPPAGCRPDVYQRIEAFLADTMEVSLLPDGVHIPSDYRSVKSDVFLESFKGKASRVSCTGSNDTDLVLVVNDRIYRVDAHIQGNRITRIVFPEVATDALDCNSNIRA
jgi:hypothetical protein